MMFPPGGSPQNNFLNPYPINKLAPGQANLTRSGDLTSEFANTKAKDDSDASNELSNQLSNLKVKTDSLTPADIANIPENARLKALGDLLSQKENSKLRESMSPSLLNMVNRFTNATAQVSTESAPVQTPQNN